MVTAAWNTSELKVFSQSNKACVTCCNWCQYCPSHETTPQTVTLLVTRLTECGCINGGYISWPDGLDACTLYWNGADSQSPDDEGFAGPPYSEAWAPHINGKYTLTQVGGGVSGNCQWKYTKDLTATDIKIWAWPEEDCENTEFGDPCGYVEAYDVTFTAIRTASDKIKVDIEIRFGPTGNYGHCHIGSWEIDCTGDPCLCCTGDVTDLLSAVNCGHSHCMDDGMIDLWTEDCNPCDTAPIWNSSTSYALDDYVVHGGSCYRCIQANTNQEPPDTDYWHFVE